MNLSGSGIARFRAFAAVGAWEVRSSRFEVPGSAAGAGK